MQATLKTFLVNFFVKTCIPVNFSVFFASSSVFLLLFFIFSDHSVRVTYLGFHALLYFEHQFFLGLDNGYCCNKET